MSRTEGMTIVAAALYLDGVTFSEKQPARHHDIAHKMHDLIGDRVHGAEQGFLTNTGIFVRREPALRIATEAGQLKGEPLNARRLFSEDVW